MIWTVNREEFAAALKLAAICADKRNTIPILSHVLLETWPNGKLVISASDLDREVHIPVDATLDGVGSVAVDSSLLLDIASRTSGETVRLEIGDGIVTATSGRSRFKLASLPGRDFPKIGFTEGEEASTFDLAPGALQAAIGETIYAVDSEAVRAYLTGLLVHAVGMRWCCVGTDGHRFARAEFQFPADGDHLPPFILPVKSAVLIRRLFPNWNLTLQLNEHKACFTGNGTLFITKLVDAVYPDYSGHIPQDATHTVTLKREDFAAAVGRVAPFAGDTGVVCSFLPDSMKISTRERNREGSDEIASAGEVPFDFLVNHTYLVDVLEKLKGDDLTLEFTAKGAPLILKDHRKEILHLVMPRLI
jgi:DNA polymerase III subunit beta